MIKQKIQRILDKEANDLPLATKALPLAQRAKAQPLPSNKILKQKTQTVAEPKNQRDDPQSSYFDGNETTPVPGFGTEQSISPLINAGQNISSDHLDLKNSHPNILKLNEQSVEDAGTG